MGTNTKGPPQLGNVQEVREVGTLVLNGISLLISSPQGSENPVEEEVRRLYEV